MILEVKFTEDELKVLSEVISIVVNQQENKIENLYDVGPKNVQIIDTATRIILTLNKLQSKIELAENLATSQH